MTNATPEQLDDAKRWMSALPRDQFDMLLLLIRERELAAIIETTERAAKYIEGDDPAPFHTYYATALRNQEFLKDD